MHGPTIVLDGTWLGRRKTGNETYIRGLIEGWEQTGTDDFQIKILHHENFSPPTATKLDWKKIRLGNFLQRNFLTIPGELKKLHSDLYHATYWTRFWDSDAKVITVHDISFVTFPESYRRHDAFLFSKLGEWSSKRSNLVITVSEFSKSEICRHWRIDPDRVVVTYEGLDSIFRPETRSRTPGDYILYVGNLHPRKNLVRLLKAFVLLRRQEKCDIKLKVVGQTAWAYDDIFETVRENKMEDLVQFTGYVSSEELVRLYQNATVAVYPSLYEGFGFPVLEAMGCGAPVVTSNTTSIPEVAGEACLLVDPKSVEAIAAGMWKVIASESLQQKMRSDGLDRAKKFTWRECAAQTLQAYRKALTF